MKWETTNTNQTVSMIGMSLRDFIYFPNVPSQESPLASGMASARAPRLGETGRPFSPLPRICQPELAEAMPEVPKGR